jgi:hypothetical protein
MILGLACTLNAQSTAPDSIVQVTLGNLGVPLMARLDLPLVGGTYFLINSNANVLPLPCAPPDESLPIFALSDSKFIVDGTRGMAQVSRHRAGYGTVDDVLAAQANAVENLVSQNEARQMRPMMRNMGMDSPSFQTDSTDDSGFYNDADSYTWDTNQLWLEITNVTTTTTFANLHNATNQVYAIWSTTNLATPLSDWQVATELWPADTNCQPFTVPDFGGQNLYLRAEDWTDIDSDSDGIPDWWIWKYFGDFNHTGSDYDINGNTLFGHTLLYDYQNSINPTVSLDTDHDGLLDSWELSHFGTLSFSGTNLDSGGVNTLLYDYNNGVDPNVVGFSLVVTNNYVNSSSVPSTVNILSGVPSYFSVIVDDTNLNGATWSPYISTNISISLGSGAGWHNVWVGLRGMSPDSIQTWQYKHLNLCYPPTITITNPVNGNVSQPIIQIYGFCQASLANISYDVSNSFGVIVNQQSQITDKYYDESAGEFTTNYFECLDVPLTNGLNSVTIHAADYAGNVITTNFLFTLDYSTKPIPIAQITWPQNGMQICNSNFTIRGTSSDPTANVSAQAFPTNGNTNVYSATVERSGRFWLENLPLVNGTNNYVVTVRDVVGNTVTTNISVIRDALSMAINPVSPSSNLWKPTVNLTGTISINNYAIWVNGVKGHNSGNGTWYCNNVPVNGDGTANFTATAYAPTEQQPDGSYGN